MEAAVENPAGDSDVTVPGPGRRRPLGFFQVWSSIWPYHSKIFPDMLQGCGIATVISAVTA